VAILGAHMSIAGGYFRAVQEAAECQCDCVQLFTKNNNQWRAKDITADDVQCFRKELEKTGVHHPISHSSYLINLAAPDRQLWQKSVDGMVVELQRATQLGIPYVVVHPGAFTESSEASGLQRIIDAIQEIHQRLPEDSAQTLLETTAGQGSCLGWQFSQLATILQGATQPERLGVCFDTCHVFAAGYPIHEKSGFAETLAEFDSAIGLRQIKAFHLNDSVKGLGSRVDRHAHIGQGMLGLDPFRWLLQDARFREIPMYLETPKGDRDGGESWDQRNLQTLRALER